MTITRVRKAVRSFVFTYLVFVVSRYRHTLVARVLSYASLAYQKAIGNCSFDMRLNGERRVLEVLSRDSSFALLFDVGANRGDWTREARKAFPAATIHCFEVAPPTFVTLRRSIGNDPRVVLNDFGLADRTARIRIDYAPDDDGLTSMLARDGKTGSTQIDVDTRAGDEYVASAAIGVIDFLKIDVEGAEPFVFAGFAKTLGAGAIRVVQFEYGHAQSTLRAFYEQLEGYGYVVGKIFPDGCAFDGYRAEREPVASNYIAVRADQKDVIAALGGPVR